MNSMLNEMRRKNAYTERRRVSLPARYQPHACQGRTATANRTKIAPQARSSPPSSTNTSSTTPQDHMSSVPPYSYYTLCKHGLGSGRSADRLTGWLGAQADLTPAQSQAPAACTPTKQGAQHTLLCSNSTPSFSTPNLSCLRCVDHSNKKHSSPTRTRRIGQLTCLPVDSPTHTHTQAPVLGFLAHHTNTHSAPPPTLRQAWSPMVATQMCLRLPTHA